MKRESVKQCSCVSVYERECHNDYDNDIFGAVHQTVNSNGAIIVFCCKFLLVFFRSCSLLLLDSLNIRVGQVSITLVFSCRCCILFSFFLSYIVITISLFFFYSLLLVLHTFRFTIVNMYVCEFIYTDFFVFRIFFIFNSIFSTAAVLFGGKFIWETKEQKNMKRNI